LRVRKLEQELETIAAATAAAAAAAAAATVLSTSTNTPTSSVVDATHSPGDLNKSPYVESLERMRQALPNDQPVYPAVLTSLNDMAKMFGSQGRYDEAKPIFIEALAVVKRELPGQHMELAHALNNLATVCNAQGRAGEAEPLFIEALSRMKKAPGINDANIARCLNNLVSDAINEYRSILLVCLLRYGT
jgi:tetratricopeptide (TPR) repeat protein